MSDDEEWPDEVGSDEEHEDEMMDTTPPALLKKLSTITETIVAIPASKMRD